MVSILICTRLLVNQKAPCSRSKTCRGIQLYDTHINSVNKALILRDMNNHLNFLNFHGTYYTLNVRSRGKQFCFPESPAVSRDEVEGIIRTLSLFFFAYSCTILI